MRELIWLDYLTITIAILAFLQPWIIRLYDYIKRKFFIKPEISCYCGNVVELHFNNLGAGMSLPLSLISKKCDSVINFFQIDIFEGGIEDSKKIYTLEWTGLNAPYSSYMIGANGWNINTTSLLLSPIYCAKDAPVSYAVQFTDLEVKNEINDILLDASLSLEEKRSRLLTKLSYKKSEYTIILTLSDTEEQVNVFEYSFRLSHYDIEILINNIDAIITNKLDRIKSVQVELQ